MQGNDKGPEPEVDQQEPGPEQTQASEDTKAEAPSEPDDDTEAFIDISLEDPQEERIADLEAEVNDLKDKLLRALAEAENVRRRAERDKTDAQRFAITKFARDLLSVADNLGRALQSADPELRKTNEALEGLCVGIEMTERELQTAFQHAGIKTVNPEGAPFDHHQHEALFEIPNTTVAAGTVMQVVEVGYMLNDRLLRPAKVGIAKGGPKPDAPADKTEPHGDQKDGQKTYEQQADAAKGPAGGAIDEEL